MNLKAVLRGRRFEDVEGVKENMAAESLAMFLSLLMTVVCKKCVAVRRGYVVE
jgi:hypothetical protein